MESDGGRLSTASSISGVYSNLLKSPAPICMFYFSHPFGISTPVIIQNQNNLNEFCTQTSPQKFVKKDKNGKIESGRNWNLLEENRLSAFVPWPKDTWKREHVPPLVQMLAKKQGRNIPDLEEILKTIRQAWNTPPNNRSLLQSRAKDDTSTSSSNNDITIKKTAMGSGAYAGVIGAGPGLLRRRYSVPEIIMRKHTLSQQKSDDESTEATSVPTPTKISKINQSPEIILSSGSDSNLSRGEFMRGNSNDMSMRKSTLLRRFWSKEMNRHDTRSGSWSPPLRRTPQRRLNLHQAEAAELSQCKECKKLNDSIDDDDDVILIRSPKRLRLNSSSNIATSTLTTTPSRPTSTSDHQEIEQTTTGKSTSIDDFSPIQSREDVFIFMTSTTTQSTTTTTTTSTTPIDNSSQDILRVEIEVPHSPLTITTVDSGNHDEILTSSPCESINLRLTEKSHYDDDDNNNNNSVNDETLKLEIEGVDQFISKLLIDNLNNFVNEEEVEEIIQPSDSTPENNNNPVEPIFKLNEKTIYFPTYTPESKGDLSSHTSLCSEPDPQEIGIVGTGSSYPPNNNFHSIIIPRLSAIPRTESMEVQASSTSAPEDEECDDSDDDNDDSISLVDSLDDPTVSPKKCLDSKKSESFYVPIADNGQLIDEHIIVADSMPDKLKEKLARRQRRRDFKKELEVKKKRTQKFVEDKFGQMILSDRTRIVPPINQQKKDLQKKTSKTRKNTLRNEIGLLESYTIDAKGKMQFIPGSTKEKPEPPAFKVLTKKSSNQITTNKTSKSTNKGTVEHQRRKQVIKDVQSMTLYQTQADLTPDTERGPRRMYQKTEIQDGGKRIEILEIVECVDSSPDLRSSHYKSSSSGCSKKSMIPIPVYKTGRSHGFQKALRSSSPNSANSKVDRIIADLLIEALHNPDNVELIQSPRELVKDKNNRKNVSSRRTGPRRSANNVKYQQKFEVIPEERSSFSVDSSNEDASKNNEISKGVNKILLESSSCDNSTINIFTKPAELIKSIVELELEPNNKNSERNNNILEVTPEISEKVESEEKPEIRSPDIFQSNLIGGIDTKPPQIPSRGRAALENESTETQAWLGFFKRHDGSVDSANEDETHQTHQSKTVKISDSPNLIYSPISTYSITPVTYSSCEITYPPSSSGSENIYSMVDKAFGDEYLTSCLNKINCMVCNKIRDEITPLSTTESMPIPTSTTIESVCSCVEKCDPLKGDNDSVWQVCDTNLCKFIKTKIDTFDVPKDDLPQTMVPEIDTTSFVIVPAKEKSPIKEMKSPRKAPVICTETKYDKLPETPQSSNKNSPKTNRDSCSDCCFCNPDLHRNVKNSPGCSFCVRKETPRYELFAKTDHTHTQTKTKDDIISTQCTKINEKIKRSFVIPGEQHHQTHKNRTASTNIKNHLNRPKNINNIPRASSMQSIQRIIHDEITTTKFKKKEEPKRKEFRLPSPYTDISSHSYDDTGSSTDFSDCSIESPKKSQKVAPTRWQGAPGSFRRRMTGNRVQEKKWNGNKNEKEETKRSPGWSVTVAGNYHEDLAPDVEMRLKFPKQQIQNETQESQKGRNDDESDFYESYHKEEKSSKNGIRNKQPALPPPLNVNPKRNLTKANEKKSSNGFYNLPDVNANAQPMLSRQTARKAIKRVESVAVISATRTITNIPRRGQRAISYLSMNPSGTARSRQRDHSLDIGNLSSHRMSFDSQDHSDVLSVMGNAIAPEQKPKVPTMSEKDVTRRHSSCFTRNRAFLT